MRLTDRRSLLVGAATGIGRATAQAFAAEGARIVIADRNDEAGASLTHQLRSSGTSCEFVHVDVTDEIQVRTMADRTVEIFGGALDVFCNFAGVQYSGVVEDFTLGRWDAIFATNVRSQFLITKYTVPALRLGNNPTIVNMASIAGRRGGPGMTAYSASKGAVIAFARALANELAPTIRVNTVSPGWVDTPFNKAAIDFMQGPEYLEMFVRDHVPLARQGEPQEIAPLFVYLSSEESAYVTGQNVVIDGGLL